MSNANAPQAPEPTYGLALTGRERDLIAGALAMAILDTRPSGSEKVGASRIIERLRELTPSTPPDDDVREAAQTFAEYIGWRWESLEPIWQRAFTGAARKVLARPHGKVTDAERSAINGALIEGLPIWTSKLEEDHARKALLDGIVRALEVAREVHP